jgi:hypothetical protein
MSNFSNPSSSFTPIPSIPDSPTNVVGIPGIESVDLRWDVPNDGGSSITDYIVQYSSDSGATWTTTSESIILFADDISTTRNFTVYNLGIIPYIFKVCAVTEAGNSDFSTPSDPVTPYSDSYDIYIATYSTIDPNLIP